MKYEIREGNLLLEIPLGYDDLSKWLAFAPSFREDNQVIDEWSIKLPGKQEWFDESYFCRISFSPRAQ